MNQVPCNLQNLALSSTESMHVQRRMRPIFCILILHCMASHCFNGPW